MNRGNEHLQQRLGTLVLQAGSGIWGRTLLQGLAFIIVARELGSTGYGGFVALSAVFALSAPLVNFGYGAVLIRETALDTERFPGTWRRALKFTSLSGALAVIVLSAIAVHLFPGLSLKVVLLVALADLVSERVQLLYYRACQARENLALGARLQLQSSAIRLCAASVLLLPALDADVELWASLYLLASLVSLLVATLAVMRKFGFPARDSGSVRRELSEGRYFAISALSDRLYQDTDKALLGIFLGPAAAGIYTAAYRIVELAWSPVAAFLAAANARFFKAGMKGAQNLWLQFRGWLVILCALSLFAGIALWFGADATVWILGGDFARSSDLLQWLAALPLLLTLRHMLGNALAGMGHYRVRALLQAGCMALKIPMILIMIRVFGVPGVAVTALVFECVLALSFALGIARLGSSNRE